MTHQEVEYYKANIYEALVAISQKTALIEPVVESERIRETNPLNESQRESDLGYLNDLVTRLSILRIALLKEGTDISRDVIAVERYIDVCY